ncbi:uncharacterized protein EKO05_0002126 [Ascochyta rabiei]|uniref:Uncharacterized protein n=1 Tax=Didymella rabiei TaxID=5454 RepID=A0A163C4D0_DIDRA|nr:uncharacterized protein EKO05_0002126 [Ascochyta rabiei]KZM22199.1 hypothetical protein ST47_g6686 [Ascochyta rabiei]UPX11522.1 hypothetical protein EKO05_0002126 [Ascochyta rabiei]
MKYTAALLAFAVGALAQSSVTSAPATTAVPGVSPSISCLQSCDPADVTCRASCLGIARPNSSQAVETTECAAKCDQGDGTAEATKKYSDCVQSCIASLFPSSQTGSQIPGAAASSGAATGTGTKSANPTASTGASGTGSSVSQTGSATPQATNAANSVSARIGGAGLAGLLAVFAL